MIEWLHDVWSSGLHISLQGISQAEFGSSTIEMVECHDKLTCDVSQMNIRHGYRRPEDVSPMYELQEQISDNCKWMMLWWVTQCEPSQFGNNKQVMQQGNNTTGAEICYILHISYLKNAMFFATFECECNADIEHNIEHETTNTDAYIQLLKIPWEIPWDSRLWWLQKWCDNLSWNCKNNYVQVC